MEVSLLHHHDILKYIYDDTEVGDHVMMEMRLFIILVNSKKTWTTIKFSVNRYL